MIIATAAIYLSVACKQQAEPVTQKISASKLMSQMLSHYASAQSVVGTIKMTQSAQGISLHIITELQYDRPSMVYIHQVRDGSRAKMWTVTSNGSVWSYDRPDNQDAHMGPNRHVEYVTQNNITMKLSDFFGAASHSLGDMNPMLISAMSNPDWMRRLTGQWATLVDKGPTTINGQQVEEVGGKYRDGIGHSQSGEFEAYVTNAGDLVKYVLYQRMAISGVSKQAVDITTVWESNLQVGAVTNKDLYKPILR